MANVTDVEPFQPSAHSCYNYLKLIITQLLQNIEWESLMDIKWAFKPPAQP